MTKIGEEITQTVDFQLSAEQHRTGVLQGIDPELDEMKRTYHGMGDLLTKVATTLSEDVPEWAQQYIQNCIFFPQLGFLTVVPLDPESGKGMYEGEGGDDIWIRLFVNENVGYYKNKQMRDMDDYFGDMYAMICGILVTPLILAISSANNIDIKTERSKLYITLLSKYSNMKILLSQLRTYVVFLIA